jgi:DNA polymerase III subunit gamma/tau
MSYQVIARKWRPQTFSDLVGQQHVTETLGNAIKNDRVAHAYIFSGARGVGKTTAARILAKALNCLEGPTATPCGVCDSCKEIAAGTSLDVIEIDAASNRGIDQIRELREMVRYAPASSRSKVVLLDEAHMLTTEASNALLKTLEEPPDQVIFVMATTEPENLADTIRSRSQHFHFRALTFGEITDRLQYIAGKENLKIDAGALGVIARMAEGSMRDALSLLEQARAYCGEEISDSAVRELLGVVPDDALAEMVAAIAEGSADRALGLIHTFQKEGRNLQHFCREAIRHMRNLLIAKVCGADSELIAATPDQRPALAEAAAHFSEEDLTRFFQILLQTDDDLRRKPDPRVHLEMGLLRLINAARLAPLEELLTEIKTGTGGAPPTVPARRAASAGGGLGSTSGGSSAAGAASPSERGFFGAGSSASEPRTWAAPNSPNAASASSTEFLSSATAATREIPPSPSEVPPRSMDSGSWAAAASGRTVADDKQATAPSTTVSRAGISSAEKVNSPAVIAALASPLPDELPVPAPELGPTATAAVAPSPTVRSANGSVNGGTNGKSAAAAVAAAGVAAAKEIPATAGTDESGDAPALRLEGISAQQVSEIKTAIQGQQKFLAELLEHSSAWELSGPELKLYFPAARKSFAEMIEGRDSLEKLRGASSTVLGRPIRVCAKIEAGGNLPPATRAGADVQELRARFEGDPLVRSLLQRFGGKISEVRRA